MNRLSATAIAEALGERDEAILHSLDRFRLLSTRHLQHLYFDDRVSELAAARAASRTMQRLQDLGLVSCLTRRIGGVKKGSASNIWQLSSSGERYLRARSGLARRRRFVEPGAIFTNHTVAVNDVAVSLLRANRAELRVGEMLSTAVPAQVKFLPTEAPAKQVEVSVPGWLLPKAEVGFVWTLSDEVAAESTPARPRAA